MMPTNAARFEDAYKRNEARASVSCLCPQVGSFSPGLLVVAYLIVSEKQATLGLVVGTEDGTGFTRGTEANSDSILKCQKCIYHRGGGVIL